MADYNSVEEIFAGVSNAEILRNNSRQDDGVDTVTGVDWFSYAGTVCSNVYASGNSFFGLGSNSEHLKVNRRDSALWYLYREDGTLFNYYKFLRIRWSGYSKYNETVESYKLTYDLILWDTGDISLHMVDIPSYSYDGTFALGSTSYTAPTSDLPDVTFTLQEDGSYAVSYEPIGLMPPYDRKYLVRSGSALYTVVDGALSELDVTEVTAQVFRDYGIDEPPSGELLIGLSNAEVLYWQDSEDELPTVTATLTATPHPQVVISRSIDLMHSSIKGIEKVVVDCKGEPVFAVSFDGKNTWLIHDGTDWVTVDDELAGMTKATFEAITTEQWQTQYEASRDMYIRFALSDVAQSVTSVNVDFVN